MPQVSLKRSRSSHAIFFCGCVGREREGNFLAFLLGELRVVGWREVGFVPPDGPEEAERAGEEENPAPVGVEED
jgi:hypothetical protein